MKKKQKFIFLTIIGSGTGIAVLPITKRKQQKARERGYHVPYGPYEALIKRPLDAILSLLALTILSPIMVMLSFLVRIKLGSPVLFTQERPGLNEKIFRIFKYRTMTNEKNQDGVFLPDEERLTCFGKLLRSTSLDELPELINILKGEMSLVGPRPLLVEYLPKYSQEQKKRQDVRPGLTGLAQIKGRNELSWEERFQEDINYVNQITFLGDMKILLKTIYIVLKREGIHSKTSATMEVFYGKQRSEGIKS